MYLFIKEKNICNNKFHKSPLSNIFRKQILCFCAIFMKRKINKQNFHELYFFHLQKILTEFSSIYHFHSISQNFPVFTFWRNETEKKIHLNFFAKDTKKCSKCRNSENPRDVEICMKYSFLNNALTFFNVAVLRIRVSVLKLFLDALQVLKHKSNSFNKLCFVILCQNQIF